ncbi:uncharacterized protein [Aristolochia californica]|uniref:uncharacterized protein isoform X2 n=1 Tax=Aristolochia californica TaxID=171875 RepID=UPI0035DE397B
MTQLGPPRSFFKIMLDSTLKGPMCLPPRFASCARNLVDQFSYLEDISGKRWNVKLCNVEGCLAFEYGWRKFVLDHSLEFGDLLLFKYNDSHFLVEIFGRSACEKLNFLETETGSSKKGKQARNRENVEQLHPKNTVTSFGVSKENGENPHKRQKISRSNTKESPPELSNSPEGSGGFDHQRSCRNLKSSVTKRERQVKRNSPKRTIPLVQLPSSCKDSGHAQARKVVSSFIHKVPTKKPCNKSKSPASEELHLEENLCRGDVIVLDYDSEGMETEPASTGTSSRLDYVSKKSSNEPEEALGISHDHSPNEPRDLRRKSSTPCQSERASDDLDELHDVRGEDLSRYIQDVKSSSTSCKLPKIEIVLNNSVAKNMAPAYTSTGKTFHHSSGGSSEWIVNALEEPFHVTCNSSDADKHAGIQVGVKLSNTKMVEGKCDGNTVDRGSTLAENSFFCQSSLREKYDALETPSKIIFNHMINEEDAGKNRIFTSKLPVFVTESGNNENLDRSLRAAESSLDCSSEKLIYHKSSSARIQSEARLGRVLFGSESNDTEAMHLAGEHLGQHCLGNRDVTNSRSGIEQSANEDSKTWKAAEPLSFISHKESVQAIISEKGPEQSVLEAGERKHQTDQIDRELNNPRLGVHCNGCLGALPLEAEYAEAMPLAVQFLRELPSGNEVTIKSSAGSECSAYDSSKTCEILEFSCFVTDKDPVQATQSGNVPDISMLEPAVRKFQTKVLKKESKCAELASNFEDSLVGVILELDTMDLANQHIGEYPPENGDVTKSRTGIEHTAESSNTCNTPAVPSVIDKLAMQGAETRSASYLETRTRKRQCRMKEIKRKPVSVELKFNFVNDQHIGKHPSGNGSITMGDEIRPFSGRCETKKKLCQSGNQHKLVQGESLIKGSKLCKIGPSPVRYKCLISVETLSWLGKVQSCLFRMLSVCRRECFCLQMNGCKS